MEQVKNNYARTVRELEVYRLAFKTAMEIFDLSKTFPVEERYSLTDQLRRSSRSVCANLSESWHKRKYLAAFIAKLKDAQQEASETHTWLEFSLASGYLENSMYDVIYAKYNLIIAQLLTMERKATSFCKK
jgi:four helix bundle protein